MTFLRRLLYLDALLNAGLGVALIALPRLLLVDLFGQPAYPDYAFVRAFGVANLAFALVMILVAQRLEEVWWWTWAFVVFEAGRAAVLTLHAAFGLPEAASPGMWWVGAVVRWLIAFGLVLGIGRASAEAPPPG